MKAWSVPLMKYQVVSVWILALSTSTPRVPAAESSRPGVPLIQAAESGYDESLSRSVYNAILSDDIVRYDAGNVRVSTRDGVVTLSGTVRRNTIRQRMEQVARAVKGVSRVVNLLTVDPK
jgi:hypothetical protein